MEKLSSLTAISPIDGRYRKVTQPLYDYFSEYALMRYRVLVEVEYFIALCNIPLPQLESIDKGKLLGLKNIYLEFTEEDAEKIKQIEQTTNHDVKAVEYFVRGKLKECGLEQYESFIHFGLTSQDVNNTAVPLSLMEALCNTIYPSGLQVVNELKSISKEWADIPMLARTHGQPASPTRLGKELQVFVERLEEQFKQLKEIKHSAKFGGATGNFNAHHVAYPDVNWVQFANDFVNKQLGLSRSGTTTQIEHYDNLAALCDAISRINTIVIDLDRDVWQYISMGYFAQKINKEETGSSAMPHKVNPIDFENSEGNAGMANAMFSHFSAKLPISRLQRDLTDSTVLRNIGVPIAHTLISFTSLLKGLGKLMLNKNAIAADLENNSMVIAEAIQTILRREGIDDAYEQLKEFSRSNEKLNGDAFHQFIDGRGVSDSIKNELKAITPDTYTGI